MQYTFLDLHKDKFIYIINAKKKLWSPEFLPVVSTVSVVFEHVQ